VTTLASHGSLLELRRAFRALRTDDARPQPATARTLPRWVPEPGERVVLVAGCGGSSGTTTVALALATVAGRSRVLETRGGGSSGLAYAAGAELGSPAPGWVCGSRGEVALERTADSVDAPARVPVPAVSGLPVTIVDSSWDLPGVLASTGWLGDLARTASSVVLVAPATVPGLRRLEAAAALVGEPRAVAATVGGSRWPRLVEQSAGAAVRRLRAAGRVVGIPQVPALALAGLTPDPLPPSITRAAGAVLTLLEGLSS
jgi:hypothetical protein